MAVVAAAPVWSPHCVKTKECKEQWLYLRDFTDDKALECCFFLSFLLQLILILFVCVTCLTMCFQIPTITNTCKSCVTRWRQCNSNNLYFTYVLYCITLFSYWSLESAVNKADFITSITTHSGFHLVTLIETWIKFLH